MASITQRKDNLGLPSWQAKVRRKGYPPQSKTFDAKREAEAWARMVETEMDSGVFVSRAEAERTTFGELIKRYVAEVSPTHKGAESETARLNALSRHPLSQRIVATLKSSDFASYRDERLRGSKVKRPVKAATVHRELGLFRQILDQARREWGIAIPENPLDLVRRPVLRNQRNRRLSPTEEKLLFSVITAGGRNENGRFKEGTRNELLEPVVRFAIETAMRQGEILSLLWKNVDLEACTAFLPMTKNNSERTVPLSSSAVSILAVLNRTTPKVFPISKSALQQSWKRAVATAARAYRDR